MNVKKLFKMYFKNINNYYNTRFLIWPKYNYRSLKNVWYFKTQ